MCRRLALRAPARLQGQRVLCEALKHIQGNCRLLAAVEKQSVDLLHLCKSVLSRALRGDLFLAVHREGTPAWKVESVGSKTWRGLRCVRPSARNVRRGLLPYKITQWSHGCKRTGSGRMASREASLLRTFCRCAPCGLRQRPWTRASRSSRARVRDPRPNHVGRDLRREGRGSPSAYFNPRQSDRARRASPTT
ncbi:MAG: hypothetical protein JWN48_4594 [Myxococcaceae bacterium]|nr:hypothetical protein [Myxococcaceae bacterium]